MTDFTIGDRVEFDRSVTADSSEWIKATVTRMVEPEYLLELELDDARPGAPRVIMDPHHCRKLREDK